MDNLVNKNTPAWRFQTVASFILSFGLTFTGIIYLPADLWVKGFLLMGQIFTVGSAFTLAKTLRDDHEANKLINRIHSAKTEKILKDFEN
ncbi:MAG: hypothetical protein MUE81_03310 [Thermoflexibacter sp.]|nr:hypothetical protein [Thermoflexibacter sp.]